MTIYIVERESGDGLEMDCFVDWKLAHKWANVCGGGVREEHTWDADFTKEMIQTYREEA